LLRDTFDREDAVHIAQAPLNNCDFFLTFDQATIISRLPRMGPGLVAALAPLRIGTPQQVLAWLQ